MKVKVTKKHVEDGIPSDGEQCAIALALGDLGFDEVSVDGEDITLSISLKTPKEATKFINKFDSLEEPDAYDYYTYPDGHKDKKYKADLKKYQADKAKLHDFVFNLPLPANMEAAIKAKK